jgi:predicted PurR-regulated permease PerM
MNRPIPFYLKATIFLLFFTLLVYALIALKHLVVPLFLSFLLSYLLFPIAGFLERHKFPRILANLITIIFGLGIFVGAGFFLVKQAQVLFADLPGLKQNALSNVDALNDWMRSSVGVESIDLRDWLRNQVNSIFETGNGFVKNLFRKTTGALFQVFIIPVFIFCLLYYRDKFNLFIFKALPADKHETARNIMGKMSGVINSYMTGILIVVIILCIVHAGGMFLIGLKFALLLGVIAAVFNFIPYFGTLFGGALTVIFTLLTEPTPSKALWVAVYFISMQVIEHNILTPNITGSKVNLNPFITILSLILGAMMWGVAGMFLTIPAVGILKIACDHIEPLKPYGYLIGNTGVEEHMITFEKIKRFFRRKVS